MDRPLQVSEITYMIKSILEEGMKNVYVEGEISNFRPQIWNEPPWITSSLVIWNWRFEMLLATVNSEPQARNLHHDGAKSQKEEGVKSRKGEKSEKSE